MQLAEALRNVHFAGAVFMYFSFRLPTSICPYPELLQRATAPVLYSGVHHNELRPLVIIFIACTRRTCVTGAAFNSISWLMA